MCGRIALYTPPSRFATYLDASLGAAYEAAADPPSWNLPPTLHLPGALNAPNGQGRVLSRFRWGLLPVWAKDLSFSNRTFNARAETVAEKPSFRSAFKSRHLLLPIDGYYEWSTLGPVRKQPHYITRADGQPLVCAGLWEEWRDPTAPEGTSGIIRSCTIITTAANADVGHLHDRIPVVLDPEHFEEWLDVEGTDKERFLAMCAPAPQGTLVHHPVSKAVGAVRNDGPELIEPVADEGALL